MAGETRSEVDVPAPLTQPPAPWGPAALWLGTATALGHGLSYAFSLVLSRELGPADYGALGALLNLGVLVTVPATALQTQVARFAAIVPSQAVLRQGYRLSWALGLVLVLVMAALTPPLTTLLRIDSVISMLFLAAGLMPVSVIAARQGVLLGRGAFGVLAFTTVLVPALRLAGVGVVVAADMGLVGALGMQAVATWVGLAVVAALVPSFADDSSEQEPHRSGLRLRGVLTSGLSLLGLFVLANSDVLLARVFLSDIQSGIYAVGALGAKVVFWGSQFVALLVFPRVARGQGGRRLLVSAGMIVAGVGGLLAVIAIPLAAPVLDLLVGPAYAEAAEVAPWFIGFGTLLALVQLMTYAAVASETHVFSILLWATVLLQSVMIAVVAHGSVLHLVSACIVSTALLVSVSACLVRRRRT